MNRKVLIFIAGIAIVSIAVTAVTASSWTTNTPLYTVRMEQASSNMNFLPTEMDYFTYIAEKGYNLNCVALTECCGVKSLNICLSTLGGPTCELYTTKHTCEDPECMWTYEYTCPFTCFDTCWQTCSWC